MSLSVFVIPGTRFLVCYAKCCSPVLIILHFAVKAGLAAGRKAVSDRLSHKAQGTERNTTDIYHIPGCCEILFQVTVLSRRVF